MELKKQKLHFAKDGKGSGKKEKRGFAFTGYRSDQQLAYEKSHKNSCEYVLTKIESKDAPSSSDPLWLSDKHVWKVMDVEYLDRDGKPMTAALARTAEGEESDYKVRATLKRPGFASDLLVTGDSFQFMSCIVRMGFSIPESESLIHRREAKKSAPKIT